MIEHRTLSLVPILLLVADISRMNSMVVSFSSVSAPISPRSSSPSYFFPRLAHQKAIRNGALGDLPFCAEAFMGEPPDVVDGTTGTNNDNTARGIVDINRLTSDSKSTNYDVSTARGWMEHIEEVDGPILGVGAYTVIRCDSIYSKHECRWKIWGLDFHVNRLCSSYKMLIESLDPSLGHSAAACEKESKLRTDDIITALLDETEMSLKESTNESCGDATEGKDLVRTLMLTILWSPPKIGCKRGKPVIRGHAAFAGSAHKKDTKKDLLSSPIAACLAIPNNLTSEALRILPRRYSDDNDSVHEHLVGASAKISSWCRVRRPLEDPTRFKVPGSGVGEVLLVRHVKNKLNNDQFDFIDSLEILEGLTSNLFVIYKDGTVRTSPADSVLPGYARELVVEGLNDVPGLKLDDSYAPMVKDCDSWAEVFVTSAIRLIVPVNRVVIPPVGGQESTLWQSNRYEGQTDHALTRSILSAVYEKGYKSAIG